MPDSTAADVLVAFRMPSLGADMDAGTIVEWKVAPGSPVRAGDIVAVVQTDKSDLDVEAFTDAIVREIVVPVGQKVLVGTTIAVMATSAAAEPSTPVPESTPVRESTPVLGSTPATRPPATPSANVLSPVVRHLATERHVDLSAVHGSGPGGRIMRDDVERATTSRARVTPRARRIARQRGADVAGLSRHTVTGEDVLGLDAETVAAGPSAPAAAQPPDSMRRTIAGLVLRAWRDIPHYAVSTTIDLHRCIDELRQVNDERPAASRVLPAAVLARAAARAAAKVPGVNGHWSDDRFVAGEGVHLGLIVALRGGGLLVPVIRSADVRGVDEIMAEMRDLVTRARSGHLRASEMSGATFTVTQLGEGAADSVTPIIHPPQVAILGLGSIHDEARAVDGMLAVRPVVHATLVGDHRAVDGRLAAEYLTAFSHLLQEPLAP